MNLKVLDIYRHHVRITNIKSGKIKIINYLSTLPAPPKIFRKNWPGRFTSVKIEEVATRTEERKKGKKENPEESHES